MCDPGPFEFDGLQLGEVFDEWLHREKDVKRSIRHGRAKDQGRTGQIGRTAGRKAGGVAGGRGNPHPNDEAGNIAAALSCDAKRSGI